MEARVETHSFKECFTKDVKDDNLASEQDQSSATEATDEEVDTTVRQSLFQQYMEENDFVLYDITIELQETYERYGLLTHITNNDIHNILKDTMSVRLIDTDDSEGNEDE